MNKIISFILFLFISFELLSQGEIDTEHKILFRNEKSFALSLNSNGFGFGYRYGKRINIHRKFLYEGDFNIVKHKKEKKIKNPLSESLRSFVYGKTNTAFNLRAAVGMHHEIFKKADRNSVSVRFFYLGGVSAIFLKPIYYQIYNMNDTIYEWKKFPSGQFPNWYFITDRKPFLHAIDEIKVIPGLYAKTGFSFEFGKEDKRLNIIETGISLEVYPKQIKIMETENNPQILPVVYLSYRFGKVESGYHLKEQDQGIIK